MEIRMTINYHNQPNATQHNSIRQYNKKFTIKIMTHDITALGMTMKMPQSAL
jgi:hypothetical protein